MKEKCNKIHTQEYRNKFIDRLTSEMQEYKTLKGNPKMSDEVACDKIGISIHTYKSWKRYSKYSYPGYEHLTILCDEFGCTSDYLMLKTDYRNTQEKDFQLTLKQICESTGLSEKVVTALMTPHYNSEYMQDYINYFFDIDAETEKTLKQMYRVLHCEKDKDKQGEKLSNLQDKLNDIYNKNRKANNIYALKRTFNINVCKYIFNKGFVVTDYRDRKLDTVFLKSKYNLIEDTKKINTEFFSLSYFDEVQYSLKSIKKHYDINDYDIQTEKDAEKFKKHTFLNIF